jgi:hypothetical protein
MSYDMLPQALVGVEQRIHSEDDVQALAAR